jgi:hypothetical protein
MKKGKKYAPSIVTAEAPRISVSLIGWMAARYIAGEIGRMTLPLNGTLAKAHGVFVQSDIIVRREVRASEDAVEAGG